MTLLLQGCANTMFYYPDRHVHQLPQPAGRPWDDVSFASMDGTKLNGWFIPAIGPAKATVVHFHGNAQNLSAHYSFVSWLPEKGYNVFLFDYRGYGKSAGSPGRGGVFEDGVAALDYIRTRRDVDPNKLIVFGQSLGGAVAVAVLGEDPDAARGVRAVAIDSTFYSYRSVARDSAKKIPVVSLLRWPLSLLLVSGGHSPCDAVADLPAVPKLFMHGTKDSVIPFAHGERLFAAACEPKEFLPADGRNHTEAIMKSPAHRAALLAFFDKAVSASVSDSPETKH